MKTYFIDIKLADHIAISCMRDRLKLAVRSTCSKVPDSLGDQLFNLQLKWSWAQRTNDIDADFLTRACSLLNQFEHWDFENHRKNIPFYSCPVYRFVE